MGRWIQALKGQDTRHDRPVIRSRDTTLQLFNVFAQDTIALKPERLYLTVGTKLEHYTYGGFGVQPSGRLAWTPANWQTFWLAVSRANRSPARKDEGLEAGLAAFPDPSGSSTPVEVILSGNPQIKPEHVLAYEAGFRTELNGRFSLDVAAFYNRYYQSDYFGAGDGSFSAKPRSCPVRDSNNFSE